MAIKEVEFIPNAYAKKGLTTKEQIEADFREAFDKHISKFEFEGNYNYKTLGQNARDVAEKIFRDSIYTPARDFVVNKLSQELGRNDITCEHFYREYKFAIKISSVTQDDRIHVYAEIDYDYINDYKSTLEKRTRYNYGLFGNRKGTG